jgi:hypothetical protein
MVTHLNLRLPAASLALRQAKKNIIPHELLSTFRDLPAVLLDLKMLPFVLHPPQKLLEVLLAADIGEPAVFPGLQTFSWPGSGNNNREKSQT